MKGNLEPHSKKGGRKKQKYHLLAKKILCNRKKLFPKNSTKISSKRPRNSQALNCINEKLCLSNRIFGLNKLLTDYNLNFLSTHTVI